MYTSHTASHTNLRSSRQFVALYSVLNRSNNVVHLLTSVEKTKVNSQHGHNAGKELLFDVSTALWHAATPG